MKSSLLYLFFLLSFITTAQAQNTYLVSQQYGYDATDATSFLQAALNDPTAEVIIIDNIQGSTWITDALTLTRDNVTIELQPGVEIEALANALGEFEPLLRLRACSNIMIEGNGGTLRMDKTQYPSNSQFRHCILTRGAQNVTIQNLTLTGAAGDGIEVGPDFVEDVNDFDNDGDVTDFVPTVPTENLTLTNLICDDNNRQGMSVVSVIGLTVTNCTFSNTAGTEPESGVDFEPFKSYQFMQGIVMNNCTFSGNNGNGIQFAGVDLKADSPPADILIDGATIIDNGKNASRQRAGVDINNIYNPFAGSDQSMDNADVASSTGTFILRNSTIRDEAFAGINVRQYAAGLDVSFENVLIENAANTFVNANLGPVIVQPPFYGSNLNNEPCFGNAAFTNVSIIDDQTNRAQVTVSDLRAGPSGPQDVTGTITVQMTGAAENEPVNYVEDSQGCVNFTLDVTAGTVLPVSLTGFTGNAVTDCEHEITWEITEALNTEAFSVEKSSDNRQWETLLYLPTNDSRAAGRYAHRFTGRETGYYRLRSHFIDGSASYSTVVLLRGCASDNALTAYPNPTDGILYVAPSDIPREFRLHDITGRLLQRILLPIDATQLDFAGQPAGMYLLADDQGNRLAVVFQ